MHVEGERRGKEESSLAHGECPRRQFEASFLFPLSLHMHLTRRRLQAARHKRKRMRRIEKRRTCGETRRDNMKEKEFVEFFSFPRCVLPVPSTGLGCRTHSMPRKERRSFTSLPRTSAIAVVLPSSSSRYEATILDLHDMRGQLRTPFFRNVDIQFLRIRTPT